MNFADFSVKYQPIFMKIYKHYVLVMTLGHTLKMSLKNSVNVVGYKSYFNMIVVNVYLQLFKQ